MHFLADESCPVPLIRALRAAGQDVTAISEFAPGATDARGLALAADEKRVLITEDRDFGEIVFSRRQPTEGVILIRYPAGARNRLNAEFLAAVRSSATNFERRSQQLNLGAYDRAGAP